MCVGLYQTTLTSSSKIPDIAQGFYKRCQSIQHDVAASGSLAAGNSTIASLFKWTHQYEVFLGCTLYLTITMLDILAVLLHCCPDELTWLADKHPQHDLQQFLIEEDVFWMFSLENEWLLFSFKTHYVKRYLVSWSSLHIRSMICWVRTLYIGTSSS